MSSVSKTIIIGNLGRDPEKRYTKGGKAVCNFSVATQDGYGDNKETSWHKIIVWDKAAEACAEHLHKGSSVYVEGRIKYGEFTTKEGVTKPTVEIVAHTVQFLGGKSEKKSSQPDGAGSGPQMPSDDIPFAPRDSRLA